MMPFSAEVVHRIHLGRQRAPKCVGNLSLGMCALFAMVLLQTSTAQENTASSTAGAEETEEGEGLANAKYTVVTHSVARPTHRTDFVRMRDKAGTLFDCVLPSATTLEQDTTQAVKQEEEANSKKEEAAAAAKAAAAAAALAPPTVHPSLDSFLAPLVGRCFLRNEGYWNVEVCHRKRIRQFHEENKRSSVEYSLGDFDKIDQPTVTTAAAAEVATVEHSYEGGTNCDESDTARHTVVTYKCAKGKENHIESIKETSTCFYRIIFQTPLLCNHPLLGSSTVGGGSGGINADGGLGGTNLAKNTVADYLSGLVGTCFYRVEGWYYVHMHTHTQTHTHPHMTTHARTHNLSGLISFFYVTYMSCVQCISHTHTVGAGIICHFTHLSFHTLTLSELLSHVRVCDNLCVTHSQC